jgi:hypothetical protein
MAEKGIADKHRVGYFTHLAGETFRQSKSGLEEAVGLGLHSCYRSI